MDHRRAHERWGTRAVPVSLGGLAAPQRRGAPLLRPLGRGGPAAGREDRARVRERLRRDIGGVRAAAERYIGIDIDELAVETAGRILAEGGLTPELLAVPVDRTLEATAALRGEVDVFLCYAVLEHMSVDERLALLRLAREVVRPDGIIVVIETPNRLTPWDYHTSQLPFLNQLPEDLALAYAERSQREDFTDALTDADARSSQALREAFVRWGRGMSFHELELVFGDLLSHTLASSWEPVLTPERKVHQEELALDRVLAAARPDLPAAFSRCWLDVILAPSPRPAPARFLRPWPLRTTLSSGAAYAVDETVLMEGRKAMLNVDLPCPATRIVVGLENTGGKKSRVRVRERGTRDEHEVTAQATDAETAHAEITLPRPATDLELRLSRAGAIGYVLHNG